MNGYRALCVGAFFYLATAAAFAGKAVAVTYADAGVELLPPLFLPRIVGVESRLLEIKARLVGRDRRADAAVALTRKLDVDAQPPPLTTLP